ALHRSLRSFGLAHAVDRMESVDFFLGVVANDHHALAVAHRSLCIRVHDQEESSREPLVVIRGGEFASGSVGPRLKLTFALPFADKIAQALDLWPRLRHLPRLLRQYRITENK